MQEPGFSQAGNSTSDTRNYHVGTVAVVDQEPQQFIFPQVGPGPISPYDNDPVKNPFDLAHTFGG